MRLTTTGVRSALITTVACTLTGCIPGAGSRISTSYVERTTSGYVVGERPCSHERLVGVQVRIYNTEPVIWSADLVEGASAAQRLTLFESNSEFRTSGAQPSPFVGLFDVSATSAGVVFPASLPVGFISYEGSNNPVARDSYFALDDSTFDC